MMKPLLNQVADWRFAAVVIVLLGVIFLLWFLDLATLAFLSTLLQLTAFVAALILALRSHDAALLFPAIVLCLMSVIALDAAFSLTGPQSKLEYLKRETLVLALAALVSLLAVYFLWAYLRMLQQRQQLQQERFALLLEFLPLGAALVKPDCTIEFANRSLRQLLPFDPAGKPCHKVLLNQEARCKDCFFASLSSTDTPRTFRVSNTRLDRHFMLIEAPTLSNEGDEPRLLLLVQDITELVQQQQALQESSERFQAVFEGAIDALLLVTPDDRVIQANSAAVALLGYSKREFTQLELSDLLVSSSGGKLLQVEELGDSSQPSLQEVELISKDGRTLPAALSVVTLPVEGAPLLLLTLRDLSTLSKAQATLRQAQLGHKKLLETLERAGIAVFVVQEYGGKPGVLRYVNSAAEQLLERSSEELVLRLSLTDLIDEADQPVLQQAFLKAERGNPLREAFRVHVVTPAGRRKLLEARVVRYHTDPSEAPAWLGIAWQVKDDSA